VTYIRRAAAVFWKDALVERRAKSALNGLLFFALVLLFVWEFTLDGDRERLLAVLPGLLWLSFVLAGLLALGRAFLVECEHGCLEGLLVTPGDKSAVYLGKVLGNVVLLLVVEALLLALFAVFFNLDLTSRLPALSLVVVLGTVGFAAVGTLFAAMTAWARARELLFPVLLLPTLVPLLVGTVSATAAVLGGEPLRGAGHWLQLLAVADIVYLTVGVLTFDVVLEG
jgi:heme exporter protein B